MTEEGVVKFRCEWIRGSPPTEEEVCGVNRWRERLYALGLIGVYENGIGFGNMSVRVPGGKEFLITGTQTGSLRTLAPRHYTRVIACHVNENFIRCIGNTKASSESLTHGMIYEADPSAGAVFHVHARSLWQRLIGKVPTTPPAVPYGTQEMALSIRRLCRQTPLSRKKILVMAGHPEGILAFGRDPEEAGTLLLRYLYLW